MASISAFAFSVSITVLDVDSPFRYFFMPDKSRLIRAFLLAIGTQSSTVGFPVTLLNTLSISSAYFLINSL